MTKKILTTIVSGLVISVVGIAQALTLTDVGGSIDQPYPYAATALKNSGDDAEVSWVQAILGSDYGLVGNKYDVKMNEWTAIDGYLASDEKGKGVPYVYAHPLKTAPDYFMLKTANPNSSLNADGYDHFLFQNLEGSIWAVINLQDMGFDLKFISNVGKVSHIGEFNDPPGPEPGPEPAPEPAPEPSTMLLFGAGLVGLAHIARRKNQNSSYPEC